MPDVNQTMERGRFRPQQFAVTDERRALLRAGTPATPWF